MKVLILDEINDGVTKDALYDVIGVKKEENEDLEYETFYFINDRGDETYEYYNINTKEIGSGCDKFLIFNTDLEVAEYLIDRYKLNVKVVENK